MVIQALLVYTAAAFFRELGFVRSRQRLAYNHLPLAEIATACAFSDIASFYHAFSRRFGVAPSRAPR